MSNSKLTCKIEIDEIVTEICRNFDFPFDGTSSFICPDINVPKSPFGIGLIVGPSGSGKSTLLRQFGSQEDVFWDENKAVVSHFENATVAQKMLSAVGLNSIPSWVRPYHVLSTGEKFRADTARKLKNGAVIDEFTSVVDRNVARSCSVSLRRYINQSGITGIVLATCHYDVIDWLQPDWVFDTFTGSFAGRGAERRPSIALEITPCDSSEWSAFHSHHYLTGKLNKSARCWIVKWDGVKVAFVSALSFPNGNFKNAWREHRTVVLPDFQGLGIGVAASDAVASMFKGLGCRYFSKTSHPKFGKYRNESPMWRATSKNNKSRADYGKTKTKTKEDGHKLNHQMRVCYSHEFVGANPNSGLV